MPPPYVGTIEACDPDFDSAGSNSLDCPTPGATFALLNGAYGPSAVFNTTNSDVFVSNGALLSYEDQSQHVLTLVVTDAGVEGDSTPLEARATLTIEVVDENEPCEIVSFTTPGMASPTAGVPRELRLRENSAVGVRVVWFTHDPDVHRGDECKVELPDLDAQYLKSNPVTLARLW